MNFHMGLLLWFCPALLSHINQSYIIDIKLVFDFVSLLYIRMDPNLVSLESFFAMKVERYVGLLSWFQSLSFLNSALLYRVGGSLFPLQPADGGLYNKVVLSML